MADRTFWQDHLEGNLDQTLTLLALEALAVHSRIFSWKKCSRNAEFLKIDRVSQKCFFSKKCSPIALRYTAFSPHPTARHSHKLPCTHWSPQGHSMTSPPDLGLQPEEFSRSLSTAHCWFKVRLMKTAGNPPKAENSVCGGRGGNPGQPQKGLSCSVTFVSDVCRSQLQIAQDNCS